VNERQNGIFTSRRVESTSENVACSQNKYARCCQLIVKVTDLETRRTLVHVKFTLEWPCPCYLGDNAIPKPSEGQFNRMAIPLPLEE